MDGREKSCRCCGVNSPLIAEELGLCLACIRSRRPETQPHIQRSHRGSRSKYGLPAYPPRDAGGLRCDICINECSIKEGGVGYCGVRANQGGRLKGGTPVGALVSWYRDPLPTNCVASWVCAGCSQEGYPDYSIKPGPEYGSCNLAVFYEACSFDCLFCQNWHFRERSLKEGGISAEELADQVDDRTTCICYFGGDPTPQIAHSMEASRQAVKKRQGKTLRICWETNGGMHRGFLEQMIDISLETGGCIKFDLKAWNEELHKALCGVGNKRTLENFRLLAERGSERPEPPLAIASTLLVPGYIDVEEVSGIARFIASLNPGIPYSLLAFSPQYCMYDLPTTSNSQAEACYNAAKEAGLEKVKLGNLFLLDAMI